jgi:glycosyltransferase involved in cell wall biosynthesis
VTRPIKILIIHNYYQQPGGERVAVEAQVSLLRERGHSVVLYTKDNKALEQYNLLHKAALFPHAFFSWESYRQIQALVRKQRPNVAHVHNVFPLISPAVYRALKDARVPIVQTVHNFRFLCSNGLFYTRGHLCERCKYGNTFHAVRWRCYRNSYSLSALYAFTIGLHRLWGTFQMVDCFIALTKFTAQKLVESGLTTRDKVSVLGDFLPDSLPNSGSFERREPYVVYLGRLSLEKGVDVLIEAVSELPLNLKVLGCGPQAEALQALTRQLESHHVEFLGYIAGNKKWDLLRQAMATVVPSVCYETFSLAVLESLVVGTPVVASNLGSLPYVIEDGKSGLLFRPGDSLDLRQKMAWLAANPEKALAMGQYGRGIVEQRYTSQAHYKQLVSIYSQLLSRSESVASGV